MREKWDVTWLSDANYLTILLEMRRLDVESSARKQAAGGYSMASVKSILSETEIIDRLIRELKEHSIDS